MNRGVLFYVILLSAGLVLLDDAKAAVARDQTLYDFCRTSNGTCPDGANFASEGGISSSGSALIMDAAGNLYGTTGYGGNDGNSNGNGNGVVFQLSPDGAGWKETVLHRFCAAGGTCADGSEPLAGLMMDAAGNLYGTTSAGGSGQVGAGVVFELSPEGSTWKEAVLYSFCQVGNCNDGQTPLAGLIMDGAGNLYGTTENGGGFDLPENAGTGGMVFELSPTATRHGTKWNETVLHSFCSSAQCGDGAHPTASLIMDCGPGINGFYDCTGGNLFGTTANGGGTSGGTVFELTPTGAGWTYAVAYDFCAKAGCRDGDVPYAGVIIDPAGNLYGTTSGGGVPAKIGNNPGGVAFELSPTATKHRITWNETVLHNFCSDQDAQGDCLDGAYPQAGLIMDAAGDLYGTAESGGVSWDAIYNGRGIAFQLSPTGGKEWKVKLLHDFCSSPNCRDGAYPLAGLIADSQGNLYSTTSDGGIGQTDNGSFGGVVFRVTP
jgi:uncharacterized repeat protein (TIGR03803 family)